MIPSILAAIVRFQEQASGAVGSYQLIGMGLTGIFGTLSALGVAHIKGRRRDTGRQSDLAIVRGEMRANQATTTTALEEIRREFTEHAKADVAAFAEITNAFTEIRGTAKLQHQIDEALAKDLNTLATDVAAINKRELDEKDAELERLREELHHKRNP